MTIRSFSRRAPWMTTAEWRQALRHRRAVIKDFAARGVQLDIFICLRLHDYLVTLLLTQRFENLLLLPSTEEGSPMPTPEEFANIIARRERLAQLLAEVETGPMPAAPEPAAQEQPAPQYAAQSASVGLPISTLPRASELGCHLNRRQRRALARLAA